MNAKTTSPNSQAQTAAAADPLDALVERADALESGAPAEGAAPRAPTPEELQAQQAMAMVEAGMSQVVLMGFKVLRTLIARKLPELKDEWPDDLLQAPSEAAVPLLRKHVEKVMQVVGSSPELAAFVVTLVPLLLGVFNAMERAEENARKRQAIQGGEGGAASSAPPIHD